MTHTRRLTAVALSLALSACGGGGSGDSAIPKAAGATGGSLLAACGDRVVLQTDWFPEPEHGGLYQLAGADGTPDLKKGRFSGEIGDTGVTFEIRAGGPYGGNQGVSALLYSDDDIDMGFVNTDEAVQQSGKLPTVGIFAPLNLSPSALMWDPTKHNFANIGDIAKSNAKVLYFEGTTFVDYLVAKGSIKKSQLDASYDGGPSRFVAEGDAVQEVYATNEPYKYEHDLPEWGKPVAFKLVSESGYQPYPENVAVKPTALTEKRACLKQLVPLMQKAQIDYVKDPKAVNAAMLSYVKGLKSFWTLSPGLVDDAVQKMLALKIVANSPDGALGSFDMARVQKMVELLKPLYVGEKIKSVKKGVAAKDIATNEFIDPTIHL